MDIFAVPSCTQVGKRGNQTSTPRQQLRLVPPSFLTTARVGRWSRRAPRGQRPPPARTWWQPWPPRRCWGCWNRAHPWCLCSGGSCHLYREQLVKKMTDEEDIIIKWQIYSVTYSWWTGWSRGSQQSRVQEASLCWAARASLRSESAEMTRVNISSM